MDINNFNPYGLYRNNKKRTRIPRLKSSELDDQTYGFWLPFYDKKENIYLVDTYHIHGLDIKKYNESIIDRLVRWANEKKNNTSLIMASDFDYYYGGSVKVTDDTLKYFDLVCDLRDFEETKCPKDYDQKDIIPHVKFYYEHNYELDGVNLVRKNAEKSTEIMCDNLITQIMYYQYKFHVPSDYYFNELREYAESNKISETMKEKVRIILDTSKEMKKIQDKYLEMWTTVNHALTALDDADNIDTIEYKGDFYDLRKI